MPWTRVWVEMICEFLLLPPKLWLLDGRKVEPKRERGRPSFTGPLNSWCCNGSLDEEVHCVDDGDLHGPDNGNFSPIGYTS